ncbi:MAG TPA: PQQ-binding-like beta-propeller repeat protein [Gemmatimonadales bacterium]|jgi:alcohol dehydrogenase (cytochrome c)|nr:PQQ-binding-like beta-propeller repeat protein [Gemmatimonadales bacterium]
MLVALTACGKPQLLPTPESVGSGDWLAYNGSLSGERYSPLKQINTTNVARLEQRCAFETQDTVSFQSGIVAVGGILYFTAFNTTYAIDGATCALKWKFTRDEPPTYLKVNRGVAYNDGMIFRGTGDAHVLGIDAATGTLRWDVAIGDPAKGESVPMAPLAWNDLVFVGNAGGDVFGVTGRIYALDAATGRTVWQFNVIPDTGAARATWPQASSANPPTGGATWTSYALDELTATLYVTTGNPGPDFVLDLRPGDNLYANAVIGLDARTGRLQTFVQPIKRDYHDWDVSAGPALITTKTGMPMIVAAAKDGMVYGIARSWPLAVRYSTPVTTRENVDAPLSSERLTRFCPGSQGGVEWNGPAYHRASGTIFVNAIDWCTSVKLQRLDTLHGTPGQPWTGMDDPQLAFGRLDPTDRWKGWVTAVDAETGAIRWKVQMPKPMVAGISATAGGLVFTATLDGEVLAFDAMHGTILWRKPAGGAIGGGVIAYEAAGTELVAVAAGLNSPIWPVHGGPARVVVYSLP